MASVALANIVGTSSGPAIAAELAPYVSAAKPITDELGRIQVIIDFTDTAHMKYPGKLPTMPTKENIAVRKGVEFFHTEKTLALVADYEKRFGFTRTGMTSWVGSSVTAFVYADTVKRLLSDPLVRQVSDNQYDQISAAAVLCSAGNPQPCVTNPPSWFDTTLSGGEVDSWGRKAVNGKVYNPSNGNNGRKIYIIDGGVALHDDLPNMVRLNVACGSSGNCNAMDPYTYPLTGCYAHATHVAGIIGAKAGNGKTVQGAYAGFPNMVSLNRNKRAPASANNCTANNTGTDDNQGYALDYIAWDATYNNYNRMVHIATMSSNGWGPGGVNYFYGNAGPNWYRVKSITTTIWAYGIPIQPGVFFVQSAGNFDGSVSAEACENAYKPSQTSNALTDDGVMVVGAVHKSGAAVSPSSFFTPSTMTGPVRYSNWGPCVDIWAPGDKIVSTWGQNNSAYSPLILASVPNTVEGQQYTGNVPATQGWAYLSGTSMAAPFVAAAAAWLADTYGITTPAALEVKVRAHSFQYNSNTDNLGYPVNVVQLP